MSILESPSRDPPFSTKSNLQITPEEPPKLTPKRKRSNPSHSPLPWSWNWSWSWNSPLLPSPLLSPLSTRPSPESIPSFNPEAWLSAAKSILHSVKAKGTGTDADHANRRILKSLEDAVWMVNEEITGIETVVEEMESWGGISVREAVGIVEEAESNIWACLERVRAEIGEMHGDEMDDTVREAIQCLLMGNIGELDALLERMNT
ncbi:uncharacterized protein APUU_60624S [Aspergillus puulaauensis]|uniref:Uncharacterized protein n=1 Tax=Aspergillus puulaauensis TaxID=1220207 RepID=A0A7R7XU25_9EURO|nr:uncharacterized protein APUU_60624S [Aspergillus puulaauensis]BCS27576.1 hypothetical protein APUU_60624S [Aspergillus puulaauensis]